MLDPTDLQALIRAYRYDLIKWLS